MRSYIFICVFVACLFCNTSYPQDFNTKYYVKMRFSQKGEGGNFNYYEELNPLTIKNGKASLKIDYKMKDPKTAATNYVHVNGSAEGTLINNSVKLSGNGTISTYERGVNDAVMNFTLNMQGTCKYEKGKPFISGTFNFNQDGDIINGSFNAEGGYSVRIQIVRGDCKISRPTPFNNDPEYEDLKNDVDFEFGEKIKTGENTRVNIVYPDGSVFKVKSNTLIELGQDEIKMQYGEVFYLLQKMGKDFQVVCGQGILGTLGTSFIVSVDKDENIVVNLLDGKLRVKDKKGKEIILEEGKTVRVDSKKGLEEVNKISTEEVKKKFESSDNIELSGKKDESTTQKGDGFFKSGNTKIIIIVIVIVLVIIIFIAIAVVILLMVLKKKKGST